MYDVWAERHSVSCFLNSLLREWHHHSWIDSPQEILEQENCSQTLQIPLENSTFLYIPIRKRSGLGKHQYGFHCYELNKGSLSRLSFSEFLEKIVQFLASYYQVPSESSLQFLERVRQSSQNISSYLRHRKESISSLYSDSFDETEMPFHQSEQGLLLGHSFHPAPKSRSFSQALEKIEVEGFSPEMGAQFPLNWFQIDSELLFEQKSDPFRRTDWRSLLLKEEGGEEFYDRIPFPVHPWQRSRLLQIPEVQKQIRRGRIIDHGSTDRFWFPTSSVRSLYRPEASFMLKFSLSVRLTNSIRHLLPKEANRSVEVHQVFSTAQGQNFLLEYPHFKILFEPAFAALQDDLGGPLLESVVLCRENPFRERPHVQRALLAILTQDHPLGGENLIQKLIRKRSKLTGDSLSELCQEWFDRYLHRVLTPLLMAQANYGILLGGHQQNLILEIQEGLPAQVYFRDCQGTAYTPLGYSLFKDQIPSFAQATENLFEREMGSALFAYYVIVNSTLNVISALSKDDWVSERTLLSQLREHLYILKESHPIDPTCLNYLLFNETLLQKGNFFCSLQNINENTFANPASLYQPIRNPLYAG